MLDRSGSLTTAPIPGLVTEATYNRPVSASTAAPCQFAPPVNVGSISTPLNPFEPVTIGGVKSGPSLYCAAILRASALKAEALKIAAQYKLGPLFTPPIVTGSNGLRGVLMLPTLTGGANWQGAAVDAETGLLYVASVTNPGIGAVVKDPDRSSMDYVASAGGQGGGPGGARQAASGAPTPPSAPQGCGMNGPQGLPLVRPPWGRITALDLNTGNLAWMVPN